MSRAPESSEDSSTLDGRVRRGARNRERIVEALLELLRAGSLRPTAEQVADRAGVGTRTVFRHFDDMDSLYAEMDQAVKKRAGTLTEPLEPGRSLADRIDWVIDRRAAVYEYIAPFKRAAALQLWRSDFLRARHDDMNCGLRSQLLSAIPEFEQLSPAHRDAAELATSFESWNRLRTDQGLEGDAAAAALKTLLRALLGAS